MRTINFTEIKCQLRSHGHDKNLPHYWTGFTTRDPELMIWFTDHVRANYFPVYDIEPANLWPVLTGNGALLFSDFPQVIIHGSWELVWRALFDFREHIRKVNKFDSVCLYTPREIVPFIHLFVKKTEYKRVLAERTSGGVR